MSWHFLQGQEEESWEEISLGGAPDALLSLLPTSETYCWLDSEMGCCPASPSGTMLELSMASLGADVLMSLVVASPAPTYQQRDMEQELRANTADCGLKWRELSERYDPDSCSWKTHHSLLSEDLPWSSVILPKWGMTRSGVVFQHPTLARPMKGIGSGLWPTPSVTTTGGPTGLGGGSGNKAKLKRMGMEKMGTGRLNPRWTEWLMRWPLNWTKLTPLNSDALGTGKCHLYPQQHGGF